MDQTLPETRAANLLIQRALDAVLAEAPRRLDSDARVRRVQAAALLECAEKGYAGVTIARVAKRARVSTASIYATYKDRDAMLVAAIEMLFSIVAGDVIEVPKAADPVARVEQLLIAHGEVYTQPLSTEFFRLHVMLAWSGHTHLHDIGRRVFHGIDAFWRQFLAALVAEGHLAPLDIDAAVPVLLGPVERCTIISRLGCGEDVASRPHLAEVARHSAEALFALWGSDGFHRRRQARSEPLTLSATEIQDRARRLASLPGLRRPDVWTQLDTTIERPKTPKARRERILLAAAAVCLDQGYNAASVQQVAARAKVSTASVYKDYVDKADLFSSALEAEYTLSGDLTPDDSDVASAVYQVAARAADPNWVWVHNIIMASEISGAPRLVALARSHREAAEAFIAEVLARQPDAEPMTPRQMALAVNFLLGAVERCGVLSLILFGKSAVDLDYLAALSTIVARKHCYLRAAAALS